MTEPSTSPGVPGRAPQAEPGLARRVIAMFLLVVGVLLTIGSGACTGLFFIGFVMDSNTGPEFSGADLWMLPLILGGPVILLGALMWWGGARLRGRPAAPPPSAQPPTG